MLVLQKAAVKGTFSRNYLVDVGNYLGWGHQVLNKDLTATSVDRVFNPCGVSTDNYENDWIGWKKMTPFCLSGCNGTTNIHDEYGSGGQPDLSNANMMDYEFKPYFDSTRGITAGKRYVWYFSSVAEVTSTGELVVKRINQRLNYQSDPWNVYSYWGYVIGESDTDFYVFESFTNNSEYSRQWVNRVRKSDWNYVALLIPNNATDYMVGQNLKLLTVTNTNIAIFVTYYRGYANAGSGNNPSFCQRYMFVNMDTNTVTKSGYPTLYPHDTADVYVSSVPSSLIVDAADATRSKFYVAGATKTIANGCRVVRYTVKNTTDVNETPVGTVCTLSGMPGGVVIPIQNISPATTYTQTDATGSRATEINALTVLANSKEYVVFLTRPFDNYSYLPYTPLEMTSITVFEVNQADSSNLVYKYQIKNNAFGTGQHLWGFLKTADNKTLVLYNTTGFIVFKWNDASESYVIGVFNPVALTRISLDLLGQVFVEGVDNNLYVFNVNQASYIDVKFENDIKSLEYTGTPLTTNLILNAYSALSARVVRAVNIVLENATFTSGGGTARQFTTSASADSVIGITISGPGTVNVIPYVD